MIRVIIQSLPAGDDSRIQEIGRIEIINVEGGKTPEQANYEWASLGRTPQRGIISKSGKVLNHARSNGAWSLLREIFNQLVDSTEER